jgi:ketosteroid isomerase-like protein
MYKAIVRRVARGAYDKLSRGDFDALVEQFSPGVHFFFAGDHALAADLHGRDAAREWFERVGRVMPGLRLTPRQIVVSGWPWNTTVATYFGVHATLEDGSAYENTGMQLLRLRWGRVVEDLVYEDTQKLAAVLTRVAEGGVEEARAPALGTGGG